MTRNHNLTGRVEIHRLYNTLPIELLADPGDDLIVEPKHSGHTADALRDCAGHQPTALRDNREPIGETEHARPRQGGVLAETVPRHHGRFATARFSPCLPHGKARDIHHRLGKFSQLEFVFGTVLDQRPDVVAENIGGFRKGVTDALIVLKQIRQHANGLRTLARENCSKFHRVTL